jgi:site-specific DNA-methyltransferase (adenine-specific)
MTQLSLLDLEGTQTGQHAEIAWLPVGKLFPHPDNPRLIYRQDIIDTIAASIAVGMFMPEYALLVRPFGDGYQVISGHTRLKAAQQAGCSVLPCWVKDLDDEAAFMELVLANNQGELSPLEYGMHVLKYVELSKIGAGKGNKGGLSEYARRVGKQRSDLSNYRDAAKIVERSTILDFLPLLNKANHLAAIHKAPADDWQWLTELLLEEGWSVADTEAKVKAIDGLVVDDRLADWLNPGQYKKQAVKEASKSSTSDIADRVNRWSKTAAECLDKLEDSRPVWLFKDGEPYREIVSPKRLFLEKLPDIGHPSDKKILSVYQQILAWLKETDREHSEWERRQKDADAARKADEEKARLLAETRLFYTPDGHNQDFRSVAIESGTVDLVLTDPPYLLSNDGFTLRSGKEASVNKNFDDARGDALSPAEWIPVVAEWLRPGGAFVATHTRHIHHEILDVCRDLGLIYAEVEHTWYKSNSPPQLTPDRPRPDKEYILAAFKPGEKWYFGKDEYLSRYEEQPSETFLIPQCGGKERLGWHDTQKPLDLFSKLIALYCPVDGLVVDPFAGSGTTPVAAKQMQRRCVWAEKDSGHFSKAENRIAETPFFWEM